MATTVTVQPEAGEIATRRVPCELGDFSVIEIAHTSIYVSNHATLDALQAALDEIRAAMDASEEPAGDNPWNYGDAGAGVGGNL